MTTVTDAAQRKSYFMWLTRHPSEGRCACDCEAREAAFAAGLEEGQSMDMYASAAWDLTHLATVLNDRQTLTVLHRLSRFLDWAERHFDTEIAREAELGSPLWPTPESNDQEALPF